MASGKILEKGGMNLNTVTVDAKDMAEAEEKLVEALKERKFGVLWRLDAQKILKERIDKDIPPSLMFGACNPGMGYRALIEHPDSLAVVPCNVFLRQEGDEIKAGGVNAKKTVGAQFPGNEELDTVADFASSGIQGALDAIAKK